MNSSGPNMTAHVSNEEEMPIFSLKDSLKKLAHEWMAFNVKALRKEGLKMAQFNLLKFLYPEKLGDLSTIAEIMDISRPSVSGKINTLEKEGFVTRKRDHVDRRKVSIIPTGKSTDLINRAENAWKFAIDKLFMAVPEYNIDILHGTILDPVKELRVKTERMEV